MDFRELIVFITIGVINFTLTVCAYLQTPFYPAEATAKGASATAYSIVFGCYQLACLIFTPIFGKTVSNNTLKCFFTFGMMEYSISTFLFGYLGYVNDTGLFIGLSCLLRTIEGMGAACGGIAASAIGISLFPEKVSLVFATLEVCYGFGMIIGPFIGAVLYTIGGFILPFISVGAISGILCIVAYFIIPKIPEEIKVQKSKTSGLLDLLKITWIFIDCFLVVTSGIADSYLSTLLEEHLNKTFGVSVEGVGYIFALTGVFYGATGFLCSAIIDQFPVHKEINILGCLFMLASYTIVGPAPYFPFEGSMTWSVFGMVFFGIGTGFVNVSTFTSILLSATNAGYPDNVSTYALVSSLWLTCVYLGFFIGPCMAGVLYDHIGFSNGSLSVIIILIVAILLVFIEYKRNRNGHFTILPFSGNVTPDAINVYSDKLLSLNNAKKYDAAIVK